MEHTEDLGILAEWGPTFMRAVHDAACKIRNRGECAERDVVRFLEITGDRRFVALRAAVHDLARLLHEPDLRPAIDAANRRYGEAQAKLDDAWNALPDDIRIATDGDLVQGIRGLEAAYQVARSERDQHAAVATALEADLRTAVRERDAARAELVNLHEAVMDEIPEEIDFPPCDPPKATAALTKAYQERKDRAWEAEVALRTAIDNEADLCAAFAENWAARSANSESWGPWGALRALGTAMRARKHRDAASRRPLPSVVRRVFVAGPSAEMQRCGQVIADVRRLLGPEAITYDWHLEMTAGRVLSEGEEGEQAELDLQGVRDADLVWLLLPSPGMVTVGAWVEIGGALILGKPVVASVATALGHQPAWDVYTMPAPYRALVHLCASDADALDLIRKSSPQDCQT